MTRWLFDELVAGWALLGGVVLLAIVAVTVVNAGAFALDSLVRPFGGIVSGLPGYEDFVRLAVSAAGLMVFPYCQLKHGHIAVDMFVGRRPGRVSRTFDRLWQAAIAVLALFLAYWMVLGLLETQSDGVLSRVLGWPEWPFYLPGIASLLLWALVAGRQAMEGERSG